MKILITICARGGSKAIPGKNIKVLDGQPAIYYSIRIAQQFKEKYNDVTVALSTDSEEIAAISESHDLKTEYRRPPYLAGDNVGKIDAIRDVLLWHEQICKCYYDYVLDLDVTSPLRNLNDLSNAFELIQSDANAINLFSVNLANRNPYFNMVEQQQNGYYGLVKCGGFLTRQSTPKVYDLNASFYFYKRHFFDDNLPTINEFSLIYEMPHICFDLDHPVDFEFMEYLMVNQKLDFLL